MEDKQKEEGSSGEKSLKEEEQRKDDNGPFFLSGIQGRRHL